MLKQVILKQIWTLDEGIRLFWRWFLSKNAKKCEKKLGNWKNTQKYGKEKIEKNTKLGNITSNWNPKMPVFMK